ncbi:MAG: DUF4124 domain-containing protein [Gammaproteobacteria bacterium]|nr:MAG: DUF4124 domain-containing protein [Gammaproteobacteria bacterium]
MVIVRYQAIAVALMLAVTAAGTAVAGDIFKWTDEEGNLHFEDRPAGDEPERLAIQSKPTDPARIQAMMQARASSAAKAAEEKAAATPEGPSPEELQAQAEERAQLCSSYQAQLQKYITSRRLYREDDNGERVYLDEDETLAARERVENQVQEFCSS